MNLLIAQSLACAMVFMVFLGSDDSVSLTVSGSSLMSITARLRAEALQ